MSRTKKQPSRANTPAPPQKTFPWTKETFALVGIVLLGLLVYGRCVTYDYVLYDDPNIIFENPQVREGLSPAGIYWAFTNPNFGLYMPLPTITFMFDRSLFRDWAGGYHFMTLVWHLLCSCALFIVLHRLLKNLPVALVTALLFTVHPVQSMVVNWISARNEIMPAFFMLLSVEFYRQYVARTCYKRYAASLGFMLLALFSKQGVVLLPVVLLMLDYWPLRRLEINWREPKAVLRRAMPLILEKLPWFALTGLGVFFGFFGKTQFNVLDRNTLMSPLNNLGYALTAYVRYLFHLIYPVRYVTAYSPSTDWITLWVALAALLLLVAITVLALLLHARRPYLIVGWTWFVMFLLPVSGLVRYASESIALRYLYAPAIGLYLMVVFALYELFRPGAAEKVGGEESDAAAPLGYKVVAGVVTCVLAAVCFWQSGFWKDSESLAWRALAATNNTNAIAYNHLGVIAERRGQFSQAEMYMRKAMELEPEIKAYVYNSAVFLLRMKRYPETLALLEPLLAESESFASIASQYGAALIGLERHEEGRKYLERAVEIEPNYVPALFNIAYSYAQQQQGEKAIPYLNRVLEIQPGHQSARALLSSLQ